MEDAGFVVSNGGGSIVIFDYGEGTGKINNQRPHPEIAIEPENMQFTGQRLSVHFG